MKPTTRIAIAGLLSAAGHVLNAFASELGDEEVPTSPGTPKKTRGKAAAAVEPENNIEPVAKPESEKPVEPAPTPAAAPAGDITNPKYEEHRALIAPLVQGDQSTAELRAQVKKVVEKYSPNGGLKVMPEKNHAAFEKDIASLSY